MRNISPIECFNELNLFPNLRSLDLEFDGFHLDDILQLNLKQVKILKLNVEEGKEYMVREVLQKFNEIRHLTLDLKTKNENSVFNAFKDLPLLQYLIKLKVETKVDQRCDLIID